MQPIFRSSKLLLLYISLWLILMSGIRPLSVPDEGRYADISRTMFETGDWLIPRLNELPFMHKPPLLHWLTASLMEVFGPHVWVARLIPCFTAIILMIGLFVFCKNYLNERIAQFSVLILATNFLFFGSSQYINHDLLVATWMTITVFCFADFILSGRKSILFFGYMACAFAFLSKGLIGILIPGMIILPWMIYIGQSRKILMVLNPFGLILFAVIALPWVFIVQSHYPDFLHYFFIDQQFNRFSSGEFNNKQPWYFYIMIIFMSFLPILLVNGFKFSKFKIENQYSKPMTSLLIWWSISVLIFFSIPQSKLGGYILPTVAPLTILIAINMNNAFYKLKINILQKYIISVLVLILAIILLVLPLSLKHPSDLIETYKTQIYVISSLMIITILINVFFYKIKKIQLISFIFISLIILCSSISFSVKFFDKKGNTDQLQFAPEPSAQSKIVFYHYYFYDLPFLLNLASPVYIVNHWSSINTDSSALELKDGLRFEPDKKRFLWEDTEFTQAINSHEKLVIFARPDSLTLDPKVKYKVEHYRNYDVFFVQ